MTPAVLLLTYSVVIYDNQVMQNPALNKLIEASGGTSKFGASLGLKHNTISGWKAQGCIPAWRAQQVSQAFRLPIEQILPLTRRAPKKWTKRKQLEAV